MSDAPCACCEGKGWYWHFPRILHAVPRVCACNCTAGKRWDVEDRARAAALIAKYSAPKSASEYW